ncbi:uncharacterized protein BXZ73DRAFT_101955 [Epithele typhae]|uniref:uncharacterized protein n=1 Tax=Epithele typhae TaxID=378194 RepID=UPI0020085719|nr:uncharacterized protein BXZ73DRAFT_101955 [Epithele typhae]KAH9929892.1 hypothetical protein BXZ73DRAFT_101955 [Epithele typhae]
MQDRDVSIYYFEAVLRVGWCVELSSSSAITPILAHAQLQTFSLGLDQSVTPRDQPCWYRVEAVSYIASFIFVGVIYFLPTKHLHAQDQCDVPELFHDVHRQHSSPRSAGPSTSSSNAAEDIFKTACYSFYLPVALVMRLRGIPQLASLVLGDFLDYAAPPEVLRKMGRTLSISNAPGASTPRYGHKEPATEAHAKACYVDIRARCAE